MREISGVALDSDRAISTGMCLEECARLRRLYADSRFNFLLDELREQQRQLLAMRMARPPKGRRVPGRQRRLG